MELGFAKAIAVEHFSAGVEAIDGPMNEWLESNPEVEVLEIKFSTSATGDNWGSDALIIYRK